MEDREFRPIELSAAYGPSDDAGQRVSPFVEPGIAEEEEEVPRPQRRVLIPVLLFITTCVSTLDAYGGIPRYGWEPWMYALPVMVILVCHEAGHFIQARRYGVDCSLPYFLPMPLSPLGTMGAVIAMDARVGDRKALFDIGITGPLAGLIPTLVCCIVGLQWSKLGPMASDPRDILGEPLLFKGLAYLTFGHLAPGKDVLLHPMAYAGWVGLLITSLNLFPIGQLDGGHVLYGLLRRRAHAVAWGLLVGAMATVVVVGFFVDHRVLSWLLMICLLFFIGPRHPRTANDYVPLGPARTVLGWLTLAFLPFGFTPVPFNF